MREKNCPVCDSELEANEAVCQHCGVVLAILEEEKAFSVSEGELEPRVAELLGIVDTENESVVIEKVMAIGRSVAPQGEVFTCPECGQVLLISAISCTKCGAQFVEEGTEQFKCPICSSMVDISATKCLKCGAVFASEGDEAKEKKIRENDEADKKPAKGEKEPNIEKKKGVDMWGRLIKRRK